MMALLLLFLVSVVDLLLEGSKLPAVLWYFCAYGFVVLIVVFYCWVNN